MQRIDALDSFTLDRPSMVTVGMFDGVHLGHQHLIRQLVAQARASKRAAVVISFFPHPDVVLRGITGRYYLTPLEEKQRLMETFGIDLLVIHRFDEEVRHMRAAQFVDQLLSHLRMTALWATSDFALGYQREGDMNFLTAQGKAKGFTVNRVDLIVPNTDDERISSSKIRAALESGDLTQANTWLGRPYRLSGKVVRGESRGRSIGFPTANLAVWEQQVIPANGVYACRAEVNGQPLSAVTNIGSRPTFGGGDITVEAHLFDFDGDLYGQTVTLDFITRLRGEQKFSGVEDLVAQIKQDAEQARAVLGVTVG